MEPETVAGATLVAGAVLFLTGAVAWRMPYQQPHAESLPVMHADRRRLQWIHGWMLLAMFVTPAGLVALVLAPPMRPAQGLAAMASAVYGLGAVCWIVSLVFRLTVVPWAAQRTVERRSPPDGFAAFDAWAGMLYAVHMVAAYLAFALVGLAVIAAAGLPTWLGWVGIGWGTGLLAGLLLTRFSGPFNPPILAHTYTAMVGVVLLI